ncbi:MAG TPA: serine hydrolase domain-containing protein [Blastocatellia bacterium]|nr:serine hydrolase domain-containing protein [Blastocatellia bacterium]
MKYQGQFGNVITYGLLAAVVTVWCGISTKRVQAIESSRRAAVASTGQGPEFDVSDADSFIIERMKAADIVGLSVGVMRDGHVVYAKSFGRSSLIPNSTVGPNTMFAVGSVTKQFTSACILLLQEDGKLSVNDKVSKYYPNLTSADQTTLLDLMSMQSGYPDYYPLDFVDRRMARPIAPDKLIHDYATGKLDFPPRTRWSYSNTGYIILGRIVEKVSGESFGSFVSSRIFQPLQMEHTEYQPSRTEKGLAKGYTSFATGPQEPAIPEATGWAATAGGIYSTPSDLLKWDRALMDGKVLKPESYELMTTSRKLADGGETNYGCGQGVRDIHGVRLLSHGGAVSGFIAQNTLIPSSHSAVVILSNCESSDGISAINVKLVSGLMPSPREGSSGEESQKPQPEKRSDIPTISGPPAGEAAKEFLHQLQTGKVARFELGVEYNYFLTLAKVRGAMDRLGRYGDPTGVQVTATAERGGMEVAVVRFTFKSEALQGIMYRTPDGKIQEFLLEQQ